LPVSSTQPMSPDWRAWSSARYSSSTVWGRHASSRSSVEPHTPAPSPARKAAPITVVSCTTGRTTSTPSMSAWNWHSRSLAAAPAVDPQLLQVLAGLALHQVRDVDGLVGHRLQRRAGEVAPAGAAGQPDDRAAGVLVPVRRAEADEGRDEVDALVAVGELGGQLLGLGGVVDDAELVAQPLDGRAGDEDRALEHVGGAPVERQPTEVSRPCSESGASAPVLSSRNDPVP
jgi:hypothetical protein